MISLSRLPNQFLATAFGIFLGPSLKDFPKNFGKLREREFQPSKFPIRRSCLFAMCTGPTKHISVSFTGQQKNICMYKNQKPSRRERGNRWPKIPEQQIRSGAKLHKLVDPQVEIACNLFGSQISSSKPKNLLDHKNVRSTFFLALVYSFPGTFPCLTFPRLLSCCCHPVFACAAKGEPGSCWLATSFSALYFPSLAQATPGNLKALSPLFSAFLRFSQRLGKFLAPAVGAGHLPRTPYRCLFHGPTR